MRQIAKLPEPRSLTEYRASPGSNYPDFRDKQTLRSQLVREQRGLCCFCLCRIRSGDGETKPQMKIAHWHSQSRHGDEQHGDEQLDYGNLLGACMGNQGHPPAQQHCDTRQGDRDIKYNPANPDHRIDQRIRYLSDGTVISDDEEFNQQIDEILNLNADFLKQRRRGLLEDFQKTLGKKDPDWRRLLEYWNGDSHTKELNPDCQIVVCWLRKKVARLHI